MNIALNLTHDCNLRCKYCYTGRKYKCSMSVETAQKAVDYFSEIANDELTVTFFGGEPLLEWNNIPAIVNYVLKISEKKNIKHKFAITTNGVIFNRDIAQFLYDNNFKVTLSFDGSQESQNINRPFPDGSASYDAIKKNFALFLDFFPTIDIFMVTTPDSAKFLHRGITQLYENGFKAFHARCCFEADWSEETLGILAEEYRKVADFYIDQYRKNRHIFIDFIDGKLRSKISPFAACGHVCQIATREFAVSPKGNIYPCLRLVSDEDKDDLKIGDVWNEIDEEKRQQFIVSRHKKTRDCLECDHNNRCLNNCGAVNFHLTGDVNKTSGIICQHEQMAIPIADHVGNVLYEEKNQLFMKEFYND